MSSINAETAIELSMGSQGWTLVTDTSAKTGKFCAIQVIATSVFTSITGNNCVGTWTGVTVPAGTIIGGPITGFQLTSGTVLAYNGAIYT